MRLRTRREAAIDAIKHAIEERRATGHLSAKDHSGQVEVLKRLATEARSVGYLWRAFARDAVKGEATLRHLGISNSQPDNRHTVTDVDWLCAQRIGTFSWIPEAIRDEVKGFQFPPADDLYLFTNPYHMAIAILDHREHREPYPNATWSAGYYYVLYVHPAFDTTGDSGKCPDLTDWRLRTLQRFRPYRLPAGAYDLESYVQAEYGGSTFQLGRARELLDLCTRIERGIPECDEGPDADGDEWFLDDYF